MNLRLLLLSALFSVLTLSAHAGTTMGIPITRLPAVIKKPGVYVLNRSLTTARTDGAAITIESDNVTLDLNDHAITLLPPNGFTGTVTTVGITCGANSFVHIRNGLVAGFAKGVSVEDYSSEGIIIEDLHVKGTTGTASTFGMLINAFGPKIRRCTVSDTTSTTSEAFGLVVQGNLAEVSECSVLATNGGSGNASRGLEVLGVGSELRNNHVANVTLAANSTGIQTGGGILLIGNTVSNMQDGIFVSTGAKLLNNLTSGCTNAITNGTQVAGNS
jgi:hypothetical protein